MALSSFRLRRALAITSSFVNHRPFSAAAFVSPCSEPNLIPSSKLGSLSSLMRPGSPRGRPNCAVQSLSFRSSAPSYDRRSGDGDDRKIDPDEILFEGCDYNHWLITMEFPKDPKPTPEEMVETYVQTLAKVVGSVEEAKKRMYACSTTTYNGFQAVMTEEMSEKFRGLPGVVFILPDSYIDPVNKEYGGDKYDNGVITPRPPPVQYGRQGRYGDRNRNYDRPRFDRQQQGVGGPSFDRQGPPPPHGEGRNFPPPPNYSGPSERRDHFPPPGGRDGFLGERREPSPQFQRGPYQGQDGSFPQEGRDFSQGPPRGGNFPQGGPDHRRGTGSGYGGGYQPQGPGYGQSHQGPPTGQNFSRPREGYPPPPPPPPFEQRGWDGPNQSGTNQGQH